MTEALAIFTEMVGAAFPYALVFALGGKIVRSFLGMAFNGTVRF